VAPTGDPQLVEALARDDEHAIRELRRRHLPALRRAGRRVLSDDALADQVAEDVLVALWQDPGRFDPARGTLGSFLLALARRRAIDVARSEAARRRREDAAGRRQCSGYDEAEPVDHRVVHRVREAVGDLGEHEAAAIRLAFFRGHTYLEVARLLDQPEGTVKTRIRSAMTALRADLADLNPRA
jgi:RNA polymerase sigma-70 factor (ECF subfamily)